MKQKTVVMLGSMRFLELIEETAERLELENGWTVIGITRHALKRELTNEEKIKLGRLHLNKIALADAVFVVNPEGYIGKSVETEIEYARLLGREIMYLNEK